MNLIAYFLLTLNTIYLANCQILIHKCCPSNSVINSELKTCASNYNEDNNANVWNLLKNRNGTLSYSLRNNSVLNLPCQTPKIDLHIWSENYTIFQDGVSISEQSKNLEFCLDRTQDNIEVILTCTCAHDTCVHVCCPPGHMYDFDEARECVPISIEWKDWKLQDNMQISTEKTSPAVIYGEQSCDQFYALETPVTVQVQESGTLFYNESGNTDYVAQDEYCIGVIKYNDEISTNALICVDNGEESYPRTPEEIRHTIIYTILFFIGSLFLLATLVVYAMLPNLRSSIQGFSLMAHCACMSLAHIALIVIYTEGHTLADLMCHATAYVFQYCFISAFLWMNVMCTDIASKFRSLQSMVPRSTRKLRKLTYYSIYAMGTPLLIVGITLVINHSDNIPDSIHPKIGNGSCWFSKDSYAIVYYFYGPIGIVILFNTILFIFTTYKIYSYRKETSNVNRSNKEKETDRTNFILFAKLFGLMGIPWCSEIISWAVGGNKYIWYITDAFNILRPIFIFVQFCCKIRVWEQMQNHYPRLTRYTRSASAAMSLNTRNTVATSSSQHRATSSVAT